MSRVNANKNGFFNNAIGELNEHCVKTHKPYPIYEDIWMKDSKFKCTLLGLVTEGRGRTKQLAKHNAALHMIERIKIGYLEVVTAVPIVESNALAEKHDAPIERHEAAGPSTRHEHHYVGSFLSTEDFKNEMTMEEAFRRWNVTYEIEELQSNPLVLSLTTNKNDDTPSYSFAATGDNYNNAKLSLLKIALQQLFTKLFYD